MTINGLCKEAHKTAIQKGWYDEQRETGTILALVHSEVSEALEADRKGESQKFQEELADVCIRVFDLAGSKGIDLESIIMAKMAYNKTRPYKHGGKLY
ncbi:MazG nucleotide pyrophosphohydrolase domain-containing protein [Lysinibacillus fusiformis]|nr:MazG nucleotide pyrophosphohydrolase domain-containing protein [Lysinibacillus sphaericus]MDN4967771.1 MazG nucleotide pyrophosphohydrolase domain-containing protein [Lysinibacillus fusiformis]MDN4967827.1 MazG nucleotide pyrophosphohydrolase domain-containing protein [Lysinibacillus fusiformis]